MTETRKPYEPNWPHGYETRDGRKARVLCTDRASYNYPIVALVDGKGVITCTAQGTFWDGGNENARDLFCSPPPPPPLRDIWVNEYPTGLIARAHRTKEAAEAADIPNAIRVAVHYREVPSE